jgi:hypothetical protein
MTKKKPAKRATPRKAAKHAKHAPTTPANAPTAPRDASAEVAEELGLPTTEQPGFVQVDPGKAAQ